MALTFLKLCIICSKKILQYCIFELQAFLSSFPHGLNFAPRLPHQRVEGHSSKFNFLLLNFNVSLAVERGRDRSDSVVFYIYIFFANKAEEGLVVI